MNQEIRVPSVLVVDEKGDQLGEIKLDEGHDILTQVASYGSGSKTPTQFARNIAKLIDLK